MSDQVTLPIVRGGSFCRAGALGQTTKGTPMECSPHPDRPNDRLRWRRSGPTPTTDTVKERPVATPATPTEPVYSSKRLTVNTWGTLDGGPIHFHDDGAVGLAIKGMGRDAYLDINGEPLADVLGKAATDAVLGRCTAQQLLDRVKALRNQLPAAATTARRELEVAIARMDAPDTPPPVVPDVVPAPLRQLAAALHAVPIVRAEPREADTLAGIMANFAAGQGGGRRLVDAVRRLRNQRHESIEGKFEIDRAVDRAVAALEEMSRTDRTSLYPPTTH